MQVQIGLRRVERKAMDNGGTEYKETLAVVERAWPGHFFF